MLYLELGSRIGKWGMGYHSTTIKESPGVADSSSNEFLGKHNIRRGCIGGYSDTAPLGFLRKSFCCFLLYLF